MGLQHIKFTTASLVSARLCLLYVPLLLPFPVHPHMLRHACGYKLANDGQDTRAIQHTVRYTDLPPTASRSSGRTDTNLT